MKICIFTLITFILSCSVGLKQDSKENFLKIVLKRKHKRLKNYPFRKNSILISRVTKAPYFILDSLRQWEKREDLSAYMPDKKELNIIEGFIQTLPGRFKKILKERLLGIYFIKNFTGAGFTNWVAGKDKKIYCYILFPHNLFQRNLSDWLTFKDSLNFNNNIKKINNLKIQIFIDSGKKYNAFLYAFLHESAHVVDYVLGVTPYLWEELKNYKEALKIRQQSSSSHSFTRDIWKSYYFPKREYDFYYRSQLIVFGKGEQPKIKPGEVSSVYKALSRTVFVSLYSTKSWAEDFADFFTFYHLTQKLGQPLKINVFQNKSLIFFYEPMKSKKIQKRFKYMEQFY